MTRTGRPDGFRQAPRKQAAPTTAGAARPRARPAGPDRAHGGQGGNPHRGASAITLSRVLSNSAGSGLFGAVGPRRAALGLVGQDVRMRAPREGTGITCAEESE